MINETADTNETNTPNGFSNQEASALLGRTARDDVSKFSGQITGVAEHLHGDASVLISSETLHDGKVVETWFDSKRVTVDGSPGS